MKKRFVRKEARINLIENENYSKKPVKLQVRMLNNSSLKRVVFHNFKRKTN